MWQGDNAHAFAQSLATLFAQLQAAYPSQAWQTNPGTGSEGDVAHQESAQNDHEPWFDNTVRALDVDSTDPHGPDGPALFAMGNAMYGARDPRIFPDGYVIHRGQITDWDNPGATYPYTGFDQHFTHLHISVSTDTGSAGFNSTAPWPLPGSAPTHTTEGFLMALTDPQQQEVLAAARAWNKRLARVDLLLYAVLDRAGYVQVVLVGLGAKIAALMAKP